ncbi:MAG: phosphatase domain-containing protein [Gemmatimonadales bacterium]
MADFLALQELPAGPLLLRDWDLGLPSRKQQEPKATAIAEILATYPTLPFLLIGDSGQRDRSRAAARSSGTHPRHLHPERHAGPGPR